MNNLLPSPAEAGLPPKFASWRKGQDEAILRAAESPARFVVLCMPTGSGKSATYVAMAKLTDLRTVVLTSTKGLQTQLADDFSPAGLVDIRGMGNYPCDYLIEEARLRPQLTTLGGRSPADSIPMADIGPCLAGMKCEYKQTSCGYYRAVGVAKRSRLIATNYSYWLYAHREGQGLEKVDMLVLDEAHDAPEELGSFLGVDVTMHQIEGLLGDEWPLDHNRWDAWRVWAARLSDKARRKVSDLEGEVKRGTAPRARLREFRELRRLETNLRRVGTSQGRWVQHMARRGPRGGLTLRFDPVWPGEYAEKHLFLGIPKIVLTSATVRPKTMELLGVKKEDVDFVEYPSTFPIARRPVIWVPTIRVDKRTSTDEMRLWVARIDNIIRGRMDRKGIIHTVSYARRDFILKFSEFAKIMFTHETATVRDEVAAFRRADPPAVLVSPSLSTGWDFPYEECAYQIIGKVPFPDSRDLIIKARSAIDSGYAYYIAMQTLVQASGRGMRAEDDLCETLIIDDHVSWFMGKWGRQFAPKWFMDAYRRGIGIPAPPQLTRDCHIESAGRAAGKPAQEGT